MRETSLSLAVGGTAWLFGLAAYGTALIARGREDLSMAFLYNGPVTFLFVVLLTEMVVQAVRLEGSAFLRSFGGVLALWVLGGIILYLRLVQQSLEVSGHLAWLPLLTTQSWLRGFPVWVLVLGFLSTVSALYMKLAVFGGPSGIPGLVTGVLLAATLVLITRGRVQGRAMP